jgi:hypothetical protein
VTARKSPLAPAPKPSYRLVVTQELGDRPSAVVACTTPLDGGGVCDWSAVIALPLEDLAAGLSRSVKTWLDEHALPTHLPTPARPRSMRGGKGGRRSS